MTRLWWAALILAAVTMSDAKGASKVPPAPPVVHAATDPAEETADGFGTSAADARERALANARALVQRMLDRLVPDLNWQLPEDRFDADALGRMGVLTPAGDAVAAPGLGEDKLLKASVRVKLTADFLSEVNRVRQHERVTVRHLVALRVLAGLVAALVVATAYLRLEEATRGYASRLLRLAAAVVLAVVAAGLWWTW